MARATIRGDRRLVGSAARRGVWVVLLAIAAIPSVTARAAEEAIDVERAKQLAEDVRPAIVRVQCRQKGGDDIVERHAVVVDPEGWLLLAGPPPTQEGTLAAVFENGRAMPAEVWASDALSCLTVLRVHETRLPPLSLRSSEPEGAAPSPSTSEDAEGPHTPARLPLDSPFVMVTAEGAVARGRIRGSHRRRLVEGFLPGQGTEVTCLDEGAVSVISTDLGAPWLDADGRIVGLLVGADVGQPMGRRDRQLRPEVTAAYAVPSDVIRLVWPLLKVKRTVPRAALGAYVRRLSPATRKHVCPECGGYEVLDLAPRGAAERAKILPQDIIRSVDGRPMAPRADLSDVLLPHRPGQRVRLGLLRRGEKVDVDVILGRAE